MVRLIIFITDLLFSIIRLSFKKGASDLVAENLILRQQLLILKRERKRAPKLEGEDRLIFAMASRLIKKSKLQKLAIILSPAVLLRFHKALIDRKYRLLFTPGNRSSGRRGPSKKLIELVVEIKKRNKYFGCPKIALLVSKKLGIELSEYTVRRILKRHYVPPAPDSPSWLTFLGHSKDSLWSTDFFRVESIFLKTHWVMVVMDQWSRKIVGFGVKRGNLSQASACEMFNKIIPNQPLPQKMSTDNDKAFEHTQWGANLRILGIESIKSPTDTPTGHPFIERVIGTTRREFLDHILFFNKKDLENKLNDYKGYYNNHRPHYSLKGLAPSELRREIEFSNLKLDDYKWQSHCKGLFHTPVAS